MIVVQFVAGTDTGAHLIEWFGGGPPFSHVDAVMPGGGLLGARSDLVGGRPAGVQERAASYVYGCRTVRVAVPFGGEDTFTGFLRSQVGAPYDPLAIVGFVAGRDWRSTNAWFCSELIARALELAGVFKYPIAAPVNRITPADLLLMLSAVAPVVLPVT